MFIFKFLSFKYPEKELRGSLFCEVLSHKDGNKVEIKRNTKTNLLEENHWEKDKKTTNLVRCTTQFIVLIICATNCEIVPLYFFPIILL